jgi:phosphate transport system protein
LEKHTLRAFDSDLQELSRAISEMGGRACQQIADAVDALVERDTELAAHVKGADTAIDELQHAIEEKGIATIARRQPTAIDLREIVGALRICNDLERVGDLAANIAKRAAIMASQIWPNEMTVTIRQMVKLVLEQLHHVIDCYTARDTVGALEVWRSDLEVDKINEALFRELITRMMEDPRQITVCTHLLFCAKNLERIGDHATNIAESVHYIVNGALIPGIRPKGQNY